MSIYQKGSKVTIDILYIIAWSLSFLGFALGFYIFVPFGFLSAISAGLFCSCFGLVIILLIELYIVQGKKLKELQKHTQILKSIQSKININ